MTAGKYAKKKKDSAAVAEPPAKAARPAPNAASAAFNELTEAADILLSQGAFGWWRPLASDWRWRKQLAVVLAGRYLPGDIRAAVAPAAQARCGDRGDCGARVACLLMALPRRDLHSRQQHRPVVWWRRQRRR